MPHLVLTVNSETSEPLLLGGRYRLQRRHGGEVAAALGGEVILYGTSRTQRAGYFARARLTGLEIGPDGEEHVWARLDQLSYFATVVPLEEGGRTFEPGLSGSPARRRGLLAQSVRAIDEETFARIAAAGGIAAAEPMSQAEPGFAEAPQAAFDATARQGTEPDTLRGLVFAAYGHRCAFTGLSERYRLAPPDSIGLVPIRPRLEGGSGRATNFLPMSAGARRAWSEGHMMLGRRLEIVVSLDRIDPELLERMNPLGRLAAPADAALGPDPEALRYHALFVFNRRALAL